MSFESHGTPGFFDLAEQDINRDFYAVVPGTSWDGHIDTTESSFFRMRSSSDAALRSLTLTEFPALASGDKLVCSFKLNYPSLASAGNSHTCEIGETLDIDENGVCTINSQSTGVTYTAGNDLAVRVILIKGKSARWWLDGSLVYSDSTGTDLTADQLQIRKGATAAAALFDILDLRMLLKVA